MDNNKIVLKTNRFVKAGQELGITYGTQYYIVYTYIYI